ncbi:hypothetical protein COY87_03275 [Candidatus Roizmanbacteria bacterium CG_4_10_14_0_8_um_filter_33_9]|uniref:HD/PDEase domain-containing protein n=1 Tax=Candidatus Roizmanbacteria bacterium CG_4_10_14_0_8_um_filter_33_9 TaxID=1974826 RepID=A0A2M7QJ52_9BACT|nr:MAG: hypothetical protein COY87_03275 [Candidatus Roizmanbacteria bacterium CG_4_10_14_0_8_um_filter_33_9]
MKITDKIYGTFNVTSPVILEIIKSAPLQRLKRISQMGPPDMFYHIPGYSRYEHSVGVMLLLKHLGASESEQIAGLIHDVSHTAFSHIIDWVIGSGHIESYQDDQHMKIVNQSEIPSLLIHHGINPQIVLNYKHFSLLEQIIPNLCADRIDYALREFPLAIAKQCFHYLIVMNNQIVFKNKKLAQLFATHFLLRQKTHWGEYEAVTRYTLFAQTLRLALKDNLITIKDFMDDEEKILTKLTKSKNVLLIKILTILRNKDLSFLPKSIVTTQKKFRYVDPLFLEKEKVYRLSKTDPYFVKEIQKAKEDNQKGVKAGIV